MASPASARSISGSGFHRLDIQDRLGRSIEVTTILGTGRWTVHCSMLSVVCYDSVFQQLTAVIEPITMRSTNAIPTVRDIYEAEAPYLSVGTWQQSRRCCSARSTSRCGPTVDDVQVSDSVAVVGLSTGATLSRSPLIRERPGPRPR